MAEPLKTLFNAALVRNMARHLGRAGPFDAEAFTDQALAGLDRLELMQRADRIADALEAHLPADFPTACAMLRAALHPGPICADWKSAPDDAAGLRGWAIVPMGSFVARRGMVQVDLSLDTLRALTSRFSAEFAIRPFYAAHPERTLEHVRRWVADPDWRVRRLASEGLRPRLPWGIRLKALVADPAPILPILAALRDDPCEDVRRSVANALNDISKDHPDLVAGLVADWLAQAPAERAALVRHAARSLVKAGHPGVLATFGYRPPKLTAATLTVSPTTARMGADLELGVSLTAADGALQPVLIDYVMHYLRADGSLGAKVFKWTRSELAPGQEALFHKRHKLKAVTTRRHYPGRHTVAVQVNGTVVCEAGFDLSV